MNNYALGGIHAVGIRDGTYILCGKERLVSNFVLVLGESQFNRVGPARVEHRLDSCLFCMVCLHVASVLVA